MNMDPTASFALENSSYTDLNGLNKINQLGKKDQALALKELSKQFESIFLNLMLKTMRESNAVFEEGGLFQSNEMDFHRDMFDNQLALTLSEGKGIGLADAFYKQMMLQYPQGSETSAATPGIELSLPKRRIQTSPYNSPEQAIPRDDIPNSGKPKPGKPESGKTSEKAVEQKISSSQINFDGTPANFVEKIYPYARNAAEKLAIDPETLIAQAALETGWGKHVIYGSNGESSNNIFNIKSNQNWQGPSVAVSALEYKEGIAVQENSSFKKYASIQDSFDDYAQLISEHPRYQTASSKQQAQDYLSELHAAGYATDPNYVEKIMTLYKGEVIQSAKAQQIQPQHIRPQQSQSQQPQFQQSMSQQSRVSVLPQG